MESRNWDVEGSRLADEAEAAGEPTRWFEQLWAAAARDEVEMPWDRTAPYPPVLDHVDRSGDGSGRRAVVVGAGLGADAELLASRGYDTVAFDLAPSAVQLARSRHPGSSVDYRVADLLDLPGDLVGSFDLVVDVFTVQALPRSLRADAVAGVRSLLAPGGDLLAVQFVLGPEVPEDAGPPWLLRRDEMESFAAGDVEQVELRRGPHPLRADGPETWVGVFHRADDEAELEDGPRNNRSAPPSDREVPRRA